MGSDGVFDACSVPELAKIITDISLNLRSKTRMLKEIKSEPEFKPSVQRFMQSNKLTRSDQLDSKSDFKSMCE